MLIDWYTVGAQILNFLVLVWLLKRFLYKPILKAIDEREEKVRARLEEAEARKDEARKEKEEFRQKNKDFEEKRESMMNEAAEEARNKRRELLEKAREEAEELRGRLEKAIREEKENLQQEVGDNIRREVFAITRRVLSGLASQSMEEHMARAFLRRLREAGEEEKKELAEALGQAEGKAIIRSAFELPSALQEEIQEAVCGLASTGIRCRFETASEKISGVELTAGGYKIAWSVDEYLRRLETKLDELLSEKEKEELQTTTASDGSS